MYINIRQTTPKIIFTIKTLVNNKRWYIKDLNETKRIILLVILILILSHTG
jgi:hypothetical protein